MIGAAGFFVRRILLPIGAINGNAKAERASTWRQMDPAPLDSDGRMRAVASSQMALWLRHHSQGWRASVILLGHYCSNLLPTKIL